MYSRPDGRWVRVIVAPDATGPKFGELEASAKVQDAGELVKTKCSFQAGAVSSKLTFSEQNRCWNGIPKAMTSSTDYDADIKRVAAESRSAAQIYEILVTADIREACDILRPVYDLSGGADGFVSLEVSPHLADGTDGSIAEAKRLWAAVDRPNLLIKIPGTKAGHRLQRPG